MFRLQRTRNPPLLLQRRKNQLHLNLRTLRISNSKSRSYRKTWPIRKTRRSISNWRKSTTVNSLPRSTNRTALTTSSRLHPSHHTSTTLEREITLYWFVQPWRRAFGGQWATMTSGETTSSCGRNGSPIRSSTALSPSRKSKRLTKKMPSGRKVLRASCRRSQQTKRAIHQRRT